MGGLKRKPICEYILYGNKCPDADCTLDHTQVPAPVDKRSKVASKSGTQFVFDVVGRFRKPFDRDGS